MPTKLELRDGSVVVLPSYDAQWKTNTVKAEKPKAIMVCGAFYGRVVTAAYGYPKIVPSDSQSYFIMQRLATILHLRHEEALDRLIFDQSWTHSAYFHNKSRERKITSPRPNRAYMQGDNEVRRDVRIKLASVAGQIKTGTRGYRFFTHIRDFESFARTQRVNEEDRKLPIVSLNPTFTPVEFTRLNCKHPKQVAKVWLKSGSPEAPYMESDERKYTFNPLPLPISPLAMDEPVGLCETGLDLPQTEETHEMMQVYCNAILMRQDWKAKILYAAHVQKMLFLKARSEKLQDEPELQPQFFYKRSFFLTEGVMQPGLPKAYYEKHRVDQQHLINARDRRARFFRSDRPSIEKFFVMHGMHLPDGILPPPRLRPSRYRNIVMPVVIELPRKEADKKPITLV